MSSKVAICNTALAMLGAPPIRSFDEDNKRARACSSIYEAMRRYLLAKFDWPFARKYTQMQVVVSSETEPVVVPPGFIAYQLPADCVVPRDIGQIGSKDPWYVSGNKLICKSGILYSNFLHYTTDEARAQRFSGTFTQLLATGIAVKIGPSITQDKQLIKELKEQYKLETIEAWEADANIGNNLKFHDNLANSHGFVHPGGFELEDI